jgi:nucleotide-binding universal stress UspA family protein
MYRYQNVLICLNLSQVDPTVIRYAGLLTRVARSSRACFMHVVSKASLPDSFLTEYPQLAPAVDDMMRQRLVNEVDADFHGSDATERTFTILQGDKLSESLARIRDDGVDLVMLGRKREQSGHDSLEKQLTRKAPCSVLIVPEGSPPEITRVLCAVDFSEFSRRALDKALLYCRNLGLPALDAVHYYDLPTGYYKTGLSADEFAAKLEPHLHREFDGFVASVDTGGVEVRRIVRRAGDLPKALADEVRDLGADFLVLGSHGRSATASIFIGTLPEKLIWTTDIPMLVVKEKAEGAGLMKLLLDRL